MAQLCGQLGSDLVPEGGGAVPRRQISGVHISELEDPTPYLEGGELLLTTGIPVSAGAEKTGAYVRRLVQRNVAALGLGLGAGVDEVPEPLAETCAEAGLALLLVPDGTPFMNVSRAYWDLVGKGGQADLAASLGTQTALARAATRPDALASVVKALAQALGGWVVYLPADGGAETLWPDTVSGVVPQLREETARFNMAGTQSAATFQLYGTDVVEYPVLVGRRTAGYLAIGAGRKLGKTDRQIILTVCVLLSLKAQQDQEASGASAMMGAAVAKLVLKGYVDAARALAADLELDGMPGQVRLLVLRRSQPESGGPGDAAAAVTTLHEEEAWPGLAAAVRNCRLRYTADGLTYFLLDAGAGSEARAGSEAGQEGRAGSQTGPGTSPGSQEAPPEGMSAAISLPLPLEQASTAVAEVVAAARRADDGVLAQVKGGLDARAEAWVAALAGYSRADLVETVRSYLRNRGQWEITARELNLHRNSLRHRISIAAKLIDADLDDPDVAANLWLALRRTG
nr:PucR family transcriptional regulator [Arthrobacter sp. SF27]